MARGGGSGSAKEPQAGGSKRAVGLAAAANVDPELARLGLHINFVGGSVRAKQNVITEAARAIGSAKAIEKADSRFKVYVHLSGVSKDGSIAWAVLHGDSLKSSPHAARVQGQIYHLARANDSLRAGGAALMAPSAHMVGDVGGDGDPLARPSRTGRNASMMGSLVTAESELTYGEFLDAMSSPLDKVRPPGAEIVALKRALSDSGSGSGSGSHGSDASAAPSKSGKRLTADDLEAVMDAAALADPASVDSVGAVAEGRAAEDTHDLVPSTAAVAGAAAKLDGATAAPGGAAAAGSGARAATIAVAGDVNVAGFASLPSFKSTKGKGRKKMYDMPIVESLTGPDIYHPDKDTIDLVSSCLTSTRTPLSTVRLVWSCVLNGVVSRNDTASRYRSSCFPAVWPYVTPPPGSLEPFVGKHWDACVKVPNALLNKTKSKSEQLEPDGHTIATLEECPPASDTYTLMADILAGLLLVCGHDHGATVTAQLTLYRVGVPGLTREMRKAARPATRAKTSSKPITTRQTKLPSLAPRSMAGGAGLSFSPAADVLPNKASGAVVSDGAVSSPSGAKADKVTPSTSSRGSTTTTAASTESVNDGAVSPTVGQGRRVLTPGRSSARLATAAAARAAGRQASVLRAAQAAVAVVAEPAKTPPTRKRRAAPAGPSGKERRVSFAPESGGAHNSPTFTATPPQSSAPHAVGSCELLDGDGRVVAHGSADSGRKVLHNRSVPAHLVVVLVSKCVVSELLYPHEEDFPIEAAYSGPRMMSDAVSCYIVWEASKVRAA